MIIRSIVERNTNAHFHSFEKLHNKHIKEGIYEWRASIKCNLSAHHANNGIEGMKTLSNIRNVKGIWQVSIRNPTSKRIYIRVKPSKYLTITKPI